METDIQNSNQRKWCDETLSKLTCKELKKLARQSNINPNFKKAELVKALRGSLMPAEILDESSVVTSGNARRTRSRASMFPNSTTPATESVNDDRTNRENTENPSRNRNDHKKRGKKVVEEISPKSKSDILENFQIVSSISSKPLKEITNKSTLLTIENQELISGSTNKKSKQSTKSTENEQIGSGGTNIKKEETSEIDNTENFSNTEVVNVAENFKSENEVGSTNEENPEQPEKRSRRGKRTKTAQTELDINPQSKKVSVETSINENPLSTEPTTGKDKKRQKRTNSKCKPFQQSQEEKDLSSSLQHKELNSTPSENLDSLEEDDKIQSRSDDKEISTSSSRNKRKKSIIEKEQLALAPGTPEPNKKTSAESPMPVPVPVRSSTFILDSPGSSENDKDDSKKNITFELPARSNTFTIDENDPEERSQRRSLRFAPDPALQRKSATKQASTNVEKSIGKRIFENSKVHSTTKSTSKFNAGSSVKKTITKNTTTPGSVFRSKTASGAKKLPNFKSIHQRLFSNMESLGDNQKRKQERAQALLMSPAPRCAASLVSPRTSLSRQISSPKTLTLLKNSPSTTKTPRTVSTKPFSSLTNGNTVSKATTPKTATKTMKAEPIGVNRFGFKPRITKTEATTIAGKKLPPVSMEKKKDQDRKFLHGVRTNKRFMLQMQMRMGHSQT